ncbi:PH domain-containing protein [Krasilnikovia sp. M28-CT-15]|uniref:PH domain-containing protein n=1 Tax=Krasilnikovia sp. M28-CT-15 TaxID=3373540 RepID=UPI00399CE073
MSESRSLYSKFNRYLHATVAVVFGIAAISFVVVAFRPDEVNVGGLIGAGVIAALLAGVFARISRLRVVLHDDHVDVVNPLRTHRFRWADIDAIDTVVFHGWRVRIWSKGTARFAFGLSQYSKYTHRREDDDVRRDAPRWLSRGYSELRECWQSRRQIA